MKEQSGVIYILTNPSFPEYVKIGYADDVNARLKQLNNSECIPFAFRIYATYAVEERLSDLKLHTLIDQLNPNLRSIDEVDGKKRVREFYAMSKEQAYDSSEMIPWIRTFICRIVKMNFSNRSIENQFKKDLEAMYWMYDVKEEVSE